MRKKIVVAVTGGIGTGKSSVCRLLSAFSGAALVDVDMISRNLLYRGSAAWLILRDTLGANYFDGTGELDRAALRNAIFSDPTLRKTVNAFLHPLIYEKMVAEIKNCKHHLVFVDIPLLFEVGWQDDFDSVVVVFTEKEVQCERIVQRDRVTREQAEASIASQLNINEKIDKADYLIDNSCSWKAARVKVTALAEQMEDYFG
ncbi:MAG: dephospho-CoA kinase [Desulfobulbus propionicus]|nr:MAG: dephospho-CoA kinase [Desulfobulbus propionicus]